MTKSQTYLTRVLTPRDHRLVDALEATPRFRKIAAILRPPAPAPKAAKQEPVSAAREGAGAVSKPVPKGSEPPKASGR